MLRRCVAPASSGRLRPRPAGARPSSASSEALSERFHITSGATARSRQRRSVMSQFVMSQFVSVSARAASVQCARAVCLCCAWLPSAAGVALAARLLWNFRNRLNPRAVGGWILMESQHTHGKQYSWKADILVLMESNRSSGLPGKFLKKKHVCTRQR